MSDAVKGVQLLLRAAGATLAIDGIFGSVTTAALQSKGSTTLKSLVSELGLKPQAIAQSSNRWVFIPDDEIEDAIKQAVKRFPQSEKFLRMMVKFEARPGPGGVFTTFDSTFKGIAQFAQTTWNLGSKRLPEVGPFDNVHDTAKSMLLAAWYFMDHQSIYEAFRRKRGLSTPYNAELGYLYHQQGAVAAERFLVSGTLMYPGQSSASVAMLTSLRNKVTA